MDFGSDFGANSQAHDFSIFPSALDFSISKLEIEFVGWISSDILQVIGYWENQQKMGKDPLGTTKHGKILKMIRDGTTEFSMASCFGGPKVYWIYWIYEDATLGFGENSPGWTAGLNACIFTNAPGSMNSLDCRQHRLSCLSLSRAMCWPLWSGRIGMSSAAPVLWMLPSQKKGSDQRWEVVWVRDVSVPPWLQRQWQLGFPRCLVEKSVGKHLVPSGDNSQDSDDIGRVPTSLVSLPRLMFWPISSILWLVVSRIW